jgi:hypothetical protein
MPILNVVRYAVRPEQIATWERDVARIAERAREKKEAFQWNTSQVSAGELGTFWIGSVTETVEEATARGGVPQLLERLFSAKEGAELLTRTGGALLSARSQVLRDRPDLGHPAGAERQPVALVITRMTVRGGQHDAAEELIRKVAEAVPKTGDPRHFTVWQPLIGDLRTIGVTRPIFALSELDDVLPVPDLLVKAFGAAEGGLIYRTAMEALEQIESELALARPDLSNPPA